MKKLYARLLAWLIAPALRHWCEVNGVDVPGCMRSEYNQRRAEEMAAAGVAVITASLRARDIKEPTTKAADQPMTREQVFDLMRTTQARFLQDLQRAGVLKN